MASIELPRDLQDYFAFAETAPTRNGRRFCITLPYVRPDGRLDRLQWWYHLPAAKEKALGDSAPDTLRAEAIVRFTVHIERWLQNTGQDLFGDGAIPHVAQEGNRLVAAYRFESTAITEPQRDDAVEPGSVEQEALEQGQVAAGGPQAQSDHHPANKTAFA